MKLSLVVLSAGKMEGKALPIPVPQFVIGRDPNCHLRPSSALVSNRHCAVLVKGSQVFIRDLKSTNGTFVNDEQVTGEVELQDGDQLKIGPLLFRLKVESSVPVDKPTPLPATRAAAHSAAEDEAASLLLAMADTETPPNGVDEQGVAQGSTIMETTASLAAATTETGTHQTSKMDEVKKQQADTSTAAQAILSKYLRRR